MIAAAQVVFSNQHGDACLDWMSTELQRLGVACSRTEWRGYGSVVPQLLVATSPVSLTIQIDADPEYVPAEISELAQEAEHLLSPELAQALASCDARLDIMSTTPAKTEETDGAITVWAQTNLDPRQAEVERVLSVLSAVTEGFVVDCVNGALRTPHSQEWIRL